MAPMLAALKNRRVNDFWLKEYLGKGQFGVTYRAETQRGYKVAMKLSMKEAFARHESDLLQSLGGIHGVPRWEWFGVDNTFAENDDEMVWALAMTLGYKDLERMRKRNTGEYEKTFSRQNFQKILHQVITVLEKIHQKRVIHRDIKGNNVMLSMPEGANNNVHIMIVDFGWADHYEKGVASGDELNKLAHASFRTRNGTEFKPIDDVVQTTYLALEMTKDQFEGYKSMSSEKRWTYKRVLIENPAYGLPNDAKWLEPFFTAVAAQINYEEVDYDALRSAIQKCYPAGDPTGQLSLVMEDGKLKLP